MSAPSWGLDRIDQRNLPLDSLVTRPNNGSGVTAYIIDTGILTSHTEFTGRTSTGYSAVKDRYGTTDCNGHGTHVAGTVGGTTYPLERPFFVLATQNPIEYEGTFPLPEAQLDRFIVKLSVGYPGPEEEQEMLERRRQRMEA